MDYEKETRQAYRESQRAQSYKEQQTRRFTWKRFTSWREQRCVYAALQRCALRQDDKLLDFPCGTGIMGTVLQDVPGHKVAADISREMMVLAKEDFSHAEFLGFTQADITLAPFRPKTFTVVLTIGLMHRVPAEQRRAVLREITTLSRRYLIISYSLDNFGQRLKHWLLKKIISGFRPAPALASFSLVSQELRENGLKLVKRYHPAWFLSADMVLLVEKRS